ncbi:MAG: TIGR03790 family protein [Caldimonas sp.]
MPSTFSLRGLARRFGPAALAIALAAGAEAGSPPPTQAGAPRLLLPPIGLHARDIAVVVNDADPASVETGRYYASRRGIAAARVIHVSFAPGQPVLGRDEFARIRAEVEREVDAGVQAYALAWTLPYAVECMSVTSAFAFGFDPASYCADSCRTTKASPYYDSNSHAPFTDHGLRPAMLLAATDVDAVKRLIDRGLRSDDRWPAGKAYLLDTSDRARNVRAANFEAVRRVLGSVIPIVQVEGDALEDRPDVMFYFTGVAVVASMTTNRFVDGAIADHLTSFGGVLTGGGQTTALEWLSAGATGSYGTTSEPCAFRDKFPNVGVVMSRYLGGETLIEAYWKSVRMPGQGLFVGDPLARPFGGVRVTRSAAGTVVETRALPPGSYLLETARSSMGPFRPVGPRVNVAGFGVRRITLPASGAEYYRLRAVAEPTRASPERHEEATSRD